MSFVKSQQLKNLRCMKCKKYLSQFPIYQSFQPQGSICGRCPIEGSVERNIVYEEIALLQKFPCSYDVNGCLENLHPDQVPLHEQFCKFREYECPTNPTTKCKWRGLLKNMFDHFKRHHAIYIRRDNGFEVDFVGNYNENYLLVVEDELYIINQASSKSYTLSFNVYPIGSNIHARNYSYKLTLQSPRNKENDFVISKQLENETILEKNFIMKALDHPSIVIAHIEIYKPGTNEENNFEEIQWDLLTELECSCCLHYMLPPVKQCITGHSICSDCKETQSVCPTCKEDFKDTVNITLGKLIERLIYPCKNEGCKFTCKAKDMRNHQSNCTFGKLKCPLHNYEGCDQEISYLSLYDHILNEHYENLLEMDTVCAPFKNDESNDEEVGNENEDCFILRYDFRLFKLHYKFEFGEFFWAMQPIGSPIADEKYEFEIDITNNNSNRRVYFKTECSSLSDKATAFAEDKSFISIDIDQIDCLVEELTYCVRILPKL